MSRHFSPRKLLLSLLMLLVSLTATAAGLDARLDRNRVAEGESVVLTLSATGDDTGAPDLSPLETDFEVLDQAQSTRYQIVNGRSSSSHDWQITLMPKHGGRIQIPALHAGAAVSAPLSLEVVPAAQAAKQGEAQPVMLEIEAEPDTPYVQGKVVYTVRLLSRVPLSQANLTDPTGADAIVERLGEDRQYDTYRDAQNYQAIERRYAIFPQHSGTLTIEPPLLTAQTPQPGRAGRNPFADFDRFFGNTPFADMGKAFGGTRPVQLRGRPVTFDVRPQPAGTPSPWLPAESLTLSETWSPDPPLFRVGEPVTRTVTINAHGLSAAALPDLELAGSPEIKTYADKAQVDTRADGDTLIAQKTLKAALVPTHAGNFTLPAIQLAWWDTATDQARLAQLPARTVQVLAAPAGSSPPQSSPVSAQTPNPAPTAVGEGGAESSATTTPQLSNGASGGIGETPPAASVPAQVWPWLAALFAIAWLVSTGLWLRNRAAPRMPPGAVDTGSQSAVLREKAARQAVERACRENDAGAARRALLDWAAARWPDSTPRSLDALAQRLPADAATILHDIDRTLYANGVKTWPGEDAWRVLAPMLAAAKNAGTGRDRDVTLPPLYPQGA